MKALLFLLAATVLSSTPSSQQSERILHLENALLSPCCYTQPVAVHTSDIAAEMRKEIGEMVLAGQSDSQILDHYKELYGLRILAEPEGRTRTILYGLPFMSALCGLWLVMLFLHRCLRDRSLLPTPGPNKCEKLDKYRKRVQATLRDYDGNEI